MLAIHSVDLISLTISHAVLYHNFTFATYLIIGYPSFEKPFYSGWHGR